MMAHLSNSVISSNGNRGVDAVIMRETMTEVVSEVDDRRPAQGFMGNHTNQDDGMYGSSWH